MEVQVKSSNGIALVPIDTRLLANRKVFIEGDITQESACAFSKQIMLLRAESDAPIDVYINSPGGDINAGMQMYDVVQTSNVPIRMHCLGRALSMGAVLFASGVHGRYMLPHSELMLHEPLLGNRVGGNASSIRSISDSLMESKRRMNALLAKHTGHTEQEIEEACSYDHYFTAEESIAFGLADGTMGFAEMMGL